jgi:hypothetical protein
MERRDVVRRKQEKRELDECRVECIIIVCVCVVPILAG